VAPEPEGSSPHSQQPASDPYPGPVEKHFTITKMNLLKMFRETRKYKMKSYGYHWDLKD
jgi:hypothetical protein